MKEFMLHNTEVRRGLRLDPRTKILLILTITTVVIGGGNGGLMNIAKPVLSILPLVLLLCTYNIRGSAYYLIAYLIGFWGELYLVPNTTGMANFLILAMCGMLSRFLPGTMMGYFLVTTTTVSEFVAAMERMHVPMQIVIPMSVMFRFFPTIGEEYGAISDAMRMRGISFAGGRPGQMLEYRLVPLMTSTVKIGEELSAAALTRGLGKPVKRTNICKIGFSFEDRLFMLLCIFGIAALVMGKM